MHTHWPHIINCCWHRRSCCQPPDRQTARPPLWPNTWTPSNIAWWPIKKVPPPHGSGAALPGSRRLQHGEAGCLTVQQVWSSILTQATTVVEKPDSNTICKPSSSKPSDLRTRFYQLQVETHKWDMKIMWWVSYNRDFLNGTENMNKPNKKEKYHVMKIGCSSVCIIRAYWALQ